MSSLMILTWMISYFILLIVVVKVRSDDSPTVEPTVEPTQSVPVVIINTVAGDVFGKRSGLSGDSGPATSALLNKPTAIWGNTIGELFITDLNNNVVRKVDINSIISTFAGNGLQSTAGTDSLATDAGIQAPYGIWGDTVGNLFITEYSGHVVDKIYTGVKDSVLVNKLSIIAGTKGMTGFSGVGRVPSTSSLLNCPAHITGDSNGNLYFADSKNNRIRKLNQQGTAYTIETFAGTGGQDSTAFEDGHISTTPITQPRGVFIDPNNNVYMTSFIYSLVKIVEADSEMLSIYAGIGGQSGEGTENVDPLDSKLNFPTNIWLNDKGFVFISDSGNNVIRIVTTDRFGAKHINTIVGSGNSEFSGDGGPAESAGLSAPDGFWGDSLGNFFVADTEHHNIRKVYLGTPFVPVLPTGPEPTLQPSALPTVLPTFEPSLLPSVVPSVLPSAVPSLQPSVWPTAEPSALPTIQPTVQPSSQPSSQPSGEPSSSPSRKPTMQPSTQPSCQPSIQPLNQPSGQPSSQPRSVPSVQPSNRPSTQPSATPSSQPTYQPSSQPSSQPSLRPTSTAAQSVKPSAGRVVSGGTLPSNRSISVTLPSAIARDAKQLVLFKVVLPFKRVTRVSGNGFSDVNMKVQPVNTTSYVAVGKPNLARSLTLGQNETIVSTAVSYDYSGRSVSNVGDINGDGYNDLIIGVPYAARCYVLFGTAQGFVNMTEGFTIFGQTDSLAGWSVSGAGDVNNDTFADIIIGAPNADHSGNIGIGVSYVIYGRDQNVTDIYLGSLTPTQGFAIYGAMQLDQSGLSVSSAGDVNNDGFDDIVIGALRLSQFSCGVAYVLYGSRQPTNLDLSTLTSTQGIKLEGGAWAWLGYSVSGVGDVNGDGFDDVLVGSVPFRTSYGTAVSYLLYGGGSMVNLASSDIPTAYGVMISGGGVVVSGLGDINHDGYDDMLIGNNYDLSDDAGFAVLVAKSMLPFTPSIAPTVSPTLHPTLRPTTAPNTFAPSGPSLTPTTAPTAPTLQPSHTPSMQPSSLRPSYAPTNVPTLSPTFSPTTTKNPTCVPTIAPSKVVTFRPTRMPTPAPTGATVIPVTNAGTIVRNSIYNLTHYMINATGNVYITGNSTASQSAVFVLVPVKNVVTTVSYFSASRDKIDLTYFGTQTINEVNMTEGSVLIHLPNSQTIHLLNLHPSDMTSDCFVFSVNTLTRNNSMTVRELVIFYVSIIIPIVAFLYLLWSFYFNRVWWLKLLHIYKPPEPSYSIKFNSDDLYAIHSEIKDIDFEDKIDHFAEELQNNEDFYNNNGDFGTDFNAQTAHTLRNTHKNSQKQSSAKTHQPNLQINTNNDENEYNSNGVVQRVSSPNSGRTTPTRHIAVSPKHSHKNVNNSIKNNNSSTIYTSSSKYDNNNEANIILSSKKETTSATPYSAKSAGSVTAVSRHNNLQSRKHNRSDSSEDEKSNNSDAEQHENDNMRYKQQQKQQKQQKHDDASLDSVSDSDDMAINTRPAAKAISPASKSTKKSALAVINAKKAHSPIASNMVTVSSPVVTNNNGNAHNNTMKSPKSAANTPRKAPNDRMRISFADSGDIAGSDSGGSEFDSASSVDSDSSDD